MAEDKRISDVPHLEDLTGVEKIPVSAQGGASGYVEIKQIVEKAVEEANEEGVEASKLKEPVKIWGKEFDGTKNLSGVIEASVYTIPGTFASLTSNYLSLDGGGIEYRIETNKDVLTIGLKARQFITINRETNQVDFAGNITAPNITEIEDKLEGMTLTLVKVPITAETIIEAEHNRYYRIDGVIDDLGIRLPDGEEDKIVGFIVSFTTGDAPHLEISSGDGADISYFEGFSIEPNTSYELNVMWNGKRWVVAHGVIE